MRPVVTDVCVSVGQITMSDATTAEPMEMPFVAWTSVGPMNFVFGGGPDSSWGSDTYGGAPCVAAFRRCSLATCSWFVTDRVSGQCRAINRAS